MIIAMVIGAIIFASGTIMGAALVLARKQDD